MILLNKESYLEILNTFESIVGKYDQDHFLLEKIKETKNDISKFSLKVLLVGGFSAGKSALINTILERDLLVEEQNPETAIATEIVYDEREFVELFHKNGSVTQCTFDEVNEVSPEDYNHYTYHVNSEYLKKYPHITLVDMPGFNSGIERHNKAIMQYVNEGNAYVLVVDVEQGALKLNTIEFLKEIKQYDNNLSIVVTKADKKPANQVQTVLENVKTTAQQIYQKELVAVSTSKFENIHSKMDTVLNSYDVQNIFEQVFNPQLIEIGQLVFNTIEKIAQSYEFDDEGLEQEINARQLAMEQLENQLQKERKKLSQKMKNYVKPSILADVENALYASSATLAQSAISGSDAFTRQVNNILRPILISSTKKYTEESFNEFIEQLEFSNIFYDQSKSTELSEEIKKRFDTFNSSLKKILDVTDKNKNTYRIISSILAISTSVVAPWLELIIVFLPDILRLFGFFKEKSQLEEVKRKVEKEIIPQIVLKMSVEIENSLSELENSMLEEIEQRINSLIKAETEGLQSALSMRETKLEEYQQIQTEIEEDLRAMDNILQQLQ